MDSIPSTSNSILESELAQDAGDQDEGEFEQVDHFRRLYTEVLDFYIKEEEISYEAMDESISAVIESFKYGEGHRFSEVDFNRADMCCGFVFRYAAHGAALARCRVLEGLDRCPELKSILRKKEVRLASLGCGPGNDAIGFCSAMSRAKFSGTLKISLVDAISNWKDYAFKAIQLLRNGDFGEVCDLFQRKKVEFCFRRRTLPEQLKTLFLSQFDVVLICKLMSIMNREKQKELAMHLFLEMNESALLLFIDAPFYDYLWCNWFDTLYLSKEDQDYRSGDSTMREFGNHHDYVNSKSRIAVLRKKRSR